MEAPPPMSEALSPANAASVPAEGVAQPSRIKWAIAVTVALGAMLEVICRNAVGITLPFVQGNLMASAGEIGWVLAGYSVASVVTIPLVAWLDGRLSRKTCFLGSLCVFTLGSMLCGLASTPSILIAARVLQGFGGGAILASGQSILVQNFSEKNAQGVAQTAWRAPIGRSPRPVLFIESQWEPLSHPSRRRPFHRLLHPARFCARQPVLHGDPYGRMAHPHPVGCCIATVRQSLQGGTCLRTTFLG